MARDKFTYTMRERFLDQCRASGVRTFTTREILEWYKVNKNSPGDVAYPNLYTLFLNPMVTLGQVKRLAQGLWLITEPGDLQQEDPGSKTEEDEFDAYVRERLGK